ncbi:hypothetical protein I317_00038 [Kwoniella heveanensis CBS 569]|uniref:Zinc finger PHD-type domain-containing protein n=1 Tax=Kwoniella heveanensis BCC8398 TaxID=1296120 RepID=A0A1B9H1V9_9TREE|nr:hypothetical protein I316_01144 [Kwoniella heveanensis BCC8398]OCF45950.1 hypothetical protein I317_00038 [Kwoniella heveanensis CBS 569]
MEVRRRTSITSTASRSQRESSAHFKSFRSPSLGSATPKLEEEDDGTPRRTRHRNPLPPSTGPLFPPLPPKQPKNSPKNSPKAPSRSPAVAPVSQPTSGLAAALNFEDLPVNSSSLEEDAVSARSVSPDKPDLPSASNASLTPPPTSEDAKEMEAEGQELEENGDADEAEGEGEGDGDGQAGQGDWDAYRRHRTVRGFGAASVKTEPDVEPEPLQGEDNEDTPVKTRGSKNANGLTVPTGGSDTPSASTGGGSERAGSASRGRKRRGEDELLLDDHLLPADIRRTKAKKDVSPNNKERDVDEEDGDDDQADEDQAEGDADEEDDEEEGKDITRCVCGKEDVDVMMIQCDKCNVWQHGECMGIWEDWEAPDEYFCEICKPERHTVLKRWIKRSKRKNNGTYVPPRPFELHDIYNQRDEGLPTQSASWTREYPAEDFQPLRSVPKPAPPSRQKRDPTSPIADSADGRRSTRGKQPAVKSEKPLSTSHADKARHDSSSSKPPAQHRRVRHVSTPSEERDSRSPQPSAPPKRRSTMNSRDAAYEEEVKAALEASRAEMSETHEEEPPAVVAEEKDRGEKRRREDEEEVEVDKERVKKGKRKKEEEEVVSDAGHGTIPGKPKHPNQYTYRPKPPSTMPVPVVPSPARRTGGGTPAPPAPPAHHDHGTRRAGALAAAPVIYHPLNEDAANHLSWHLPDHLSAFGDLLPSVNPVALEVPAPRVLSYLPRNHFHSQHYGPFSEERDPDGKLVLPEEPPGREPVGDKSTQLDPPARPRYPVKRITTAEMKKRVRNVLEYVGRVQVEEGKRQERAKLLGIEIKTAKPSDQAAHVDGEGDINMSAADPIGEKTSGSGSTPLPESTKSMQLMDELTRDLIAFQESFTSNGFASPMPPSAPFSSSASSAAVPLHFVNGNGNGSVSMPPTPILPADDPVLSAAETVLQVDGSLEDKQRTIQQGETEVPVAEGLDVYREGLVRTVVTAGEEVAVAEKVGEIVAGGS